MPKSETAANLNSILDYIARDPGLLASVRARDVAGGQEGARDMNISIAAAIDALGVNRDGKITGADMEAVSDMIRDRPALYGRFVLGHGDDENGDETGYHLVQDDGGTLRFQGRDFLDTIADAIYHAGFRYRDGRFLNEDANANEAVDDVAGWINYFVNGENRVYGTSAAETLSSGDYSRAFSKAANEIFEAGAGDDAIWAGDGDDLILAGNGNDRSGGGEGRDRMMGEDGDDRLMGEGGSDRIYGGDGLDVMDGGTGNDRVWGGAGADTLWGNEGNDRLTGGGSGDRLGGGTGRDVLKGGAGADIMGGDENGDRLYGGGGVDALYGGDGADRLWGDGGRDVLRGGTGNDRLEGGKADDEMHGDENDDALYGGAGSDLMRGGDGSDALFGGAGNDDLSGGEGRDTITGGQGADYITSWEEGRVRDVFVFAQGDTGVKQADRDTVEGFQVGIDKIDLRDFGRISYVDAVDFSGGGRAEVSMLGRVVLIDGDGDGQIDAMIEMVNSEALTADDFIL